MYNRLEHILKNVQILYLPRTVHIEDISCSILSLQLSLITMFKTSFIMYISVHTYNFVFLKIGKFCLYHLLTNPISTNSIINVESN